MSNYFLILNVIKMVKVKLSLDRPAHAHRNPGGWGSQDF